MMRDLQTNTNQTGIGNVTSSEYAMITFVLKLTPLPMLAQLFASQYVVASPILSSSSCIITSF